MKFSIITCSKDSDEVLGQTLQSVLTQTHPEIEVVLVDAIKDRAPGFVESLPDKVKRYYVAPTGIYEALNFGISKSTGDIIGILHGGDLLTSSEIISTIAGVFEKNDRCAFVYGDCQYYNPKTMAPGRLYSARHFSPRALKYGFAPPHPSLYLKREIAAPYDTRFRNAADFDMWCHLFAAPLPFQYLNLPIAKMATGGVSGKFKNRLWRNIKEKRRILAKNGIKSALPLLFLKLFYLYRS